MFTYFLLVIFSLSTGSAMREILGCDVQPFKVSLAYFVRKDLVMSECSVLS